MICSSRSPVGLSLSRALLRACRGKPVFHTADMTSLRQNLRELLRRIGDGPAWHRLELPDDKLHQRAIQTLKENLTLAQREQYERRRNFDVTGGATGRCYRIHQWQQMNVEELNAAGRRVGLLCFMPEGRLPICDNMLAQKIALELFELEALKIARETPPLLRYL